MYKSKKVKIIYTLRDRKLVVRVCLTYLSHIRDVEVESSSTESILVVSEFRKMFSIDFSCMPSNRDTNFCIDLELDTLPI